MRKGMSKMSLYCEFRYDNGFGCDFSPYIKYYDLDLCKTHYKYVKYNPKVRERIDKDLQDKLDFVKQQERNV